MAVVYNAAMKSMSEQIRHEFKSAGCTIFIGGARSAPAAEATTAARRPSAMLWAPGRSCVSREARLCSDKCKALNTGRLTYRMLDQKVFDHFFKQPINAAPPRLTPQAFDWMLMEQGVALTEEVEKLAA